MSHNLIHNLTACKFSRRCNSTKRNFVSYSGAFSINNKLKFSEINYFNMTVKIMIKLNVWIVIFSKRFMHEIKDHK